MAAGAHTSRIADFKIKSFLSQSALQGVLQEIRQKGLPAASSRRSIKRARENAVRASTSYGELFQKISIPTEGGPNVELEIVSPAPFLDHVMRNCTAFANYFIAKHNKRPSSVERPWRIVLYTDEVSPGNQLKVDNRRKVWVIYWSFAEFESGLSNEVMWNILAIARSSTVKDLNGMTVLSRYILPYFYSPSDFRLGISLSHNDQILLVFATISLLVADEAALKSIWEFKGASGTLPCFFCKNVVLHRSDLHLNDSSGTLVSHAESDCSKLLLHTDESLRAVARMLGAQKDLLTRAAFEKLEQSVGLNHRPDGLLCDPTFASLTPISSTVYDWMHCYVVAGVFNVEVGHLLDRLHSHGVSHVAIHTFFGNLKYPHSISSRGVSGQKCFQKKIDTGDNFKCSASEALSIYSPLRYFLMSIRCDPGSDLQKAIASYFCLASVLDRLRKSMKGLIDPNKLLELIVKHTCYFKRAYSEDAITPKFHFCLHLPSMLNTHGMLISCFVMERKHKEVKRVANNLSNTHGWFESNILETVTQMHLQDLADDCYMPPLTASLVKAHPAGPDLTAIVRNSLDVTGEVQTSKTAFFSSYQQCSVNDVVLYDAGASLGVGQVQFHVSVDSCCISCITRWAPAGNNEFHVTDDSFLLQTSLIEDVCVYIQRPGAATVVIPG